jgi:hypothetical protein
MRPMKPTPTRPMRIIAGVLSEDASVVRSGVVILCRHGGRRKREDRRSADAGFVHHPVKPDEIDEIDEGQKALASPVRG